MTLEEKHNQKVKWFKDRIGQRVFRDKTACDCDICNEVYKNGLIIEDELQAAYLADISGELGITYRDKL